MIEKHLDRAIVIGVGLKTDSIVEIKESLAELEELTYAAGAEVLGTFLQILPKYTPATLLGSGKVEEISAMAKEVHANLVVIDHQLTGSQTKNLEKEIGIRVLDRSQLILDIFAQRAQTYEGKLQVELAQMLDQLPRMVGAWLGSLSRQGGGIGTRGPGETALEMDRRRIQSRVKVIKKQLEVVRKNRHQHRAKRVQDKIPSFALIGYTNSGKSTLMNALTHAQVLAKDQMFATLDPTTRQVFLPDFGTAVLTDTVGFIRKLPTQLIEAFKATLEESGEADVLIHVVDLSNPQMHGQMEVVNKLIEEFNWSKKPIIHVFNKTDIAPFEKQFRIDAHPRVFVSAKTGQGVKTLKQLMTQAVQSLSQTVELYFPKSDEHKIYELSRESQINKTESNAAGTVCFANLSQPQLLRWKEFIV